MKKDGELIVNLKFPVGSQNRDEGDPLFVTKKVRDPSSNSGSSWEFQVNAPTPPTSALIVENFAGFLLSVLTPHANSGLNEAGGRCR